MFCLNERRRIAFLACALYLTTSTAQAEPEPPNIIVIMADDLGYGDLSCYGAELIQTPNIDRLAAEGMMFTDAHAAASVCSPSRYGLVTGRSPWRLHKKGNGYKLEPGRATIASLLKAKSYRTAAIGKWHLGYGRDWIAPLSPGPLEAGFDYHFGVPTNHNDKYRAFVENHDFVGIKPGETLRVVKGKQFPLGLAKPRVEDQVDSRLTEKAIEFIRENAKKRFFLYFTPCATHTHVTPAARFRGSSQTGLYGDYVHELDAHVGEILNTLDALGLNESTLIFFTSDNGSTPKDFKGTQNVELNLAIDSHDIREKFKTAKKDARTSGHITNGPWKDGKGTPYEGGHRIPFLARWPKKIKQGTTSNQSLCLTDILATSAALAAATLPDEAAEDSISFLPVLLGESETSERRMTFIQGDTKDKSIAVGYGNWKLIATRQDSGDRQVELYNLKEDPSESMNVADQHQDVVDDMLTALKKAETEGRTRTKSKGHVFVHPGISHSQASIEFVKAKIAAEEEPWLSEWKRLERSRMASLRWTPNPARHVERGPYNHPDLGGTDFLEDGSATYSLALRWVLSGDAAYASKSAEVLDAWSDTLQSITNHDAKLLVGMAGHKYCNAAELLKHTWTDWPTESQQQFSAMIRNVFYPLIEDLYPSANGNWDASMLQTMISMAVFLDDETMFQKAIGYFREGVGNGALGNYFNDFGQCQESGRDQAHSQMGLDFLATACETAWNQNVDLYGDLDNRLLLGFEYTAKYNLGFHVRYEPFESYEGRYFYKEISDEARGRLRPMFEKVFNHYVNRKGLDAPYTRKAVEKVRMRVDRRGYRARSSSLPWGTLMYADQQVDSTP